MSGERDGGGEVKEVDPGQILEGFERRVKEFRVYAGQDLKCRVRFAL